MSAGKNVMIRALFPERPSLFAIFGGAIALFGDFANFLTQTITAGLLMTVFAAATIIAAALCLQHAKTLLAVNHDAAHEAGHCFVCDAFRFAFCAAAVFALMMIIGGGRSATESVGEMLGLIQKDVKEISENVVTIKDDVGVIRDTVDSVSIIDNPQTDFEYFNNAWIYQFVRRDGEKAWAAISKYYETNRPSKLDAAELYFNAGRISVPREELIRNMAEIGARRKDPAMLVIAGRNEPDREQAEAYYEQARRIDPDFPFAYWDMMRTPPPVSSQGAGPAVMIERLTAQKAGIDAFIDRINGKPAAAFFFLPQHQADLETVARQQSQSLAGNIATYQGMVDTQTAYTAEVRARKEARPDIKFEWRDNVTTDLLQVNNTFVAGAQKYQYRFDGGDWTEAQRVGLYHERPAKGVFELRWQDRDGEWFGPFVYNYDVR